MKMYVREDLKCLLTKRYTFYSLYSVNLLHGSLSNGSISERLILAMCIVEPLNDAHFGT